jgi:hypothetical protein
MTKGAVQQAKNFTNLYILGFLFAIGDSWMSIPLAGSVNAT